MANDKGDSGPSAIAIASNKIPFWRLLTDQGVLTQEIIDHHYPGSGTDEDPYAVTWLPQDPRNPMQFSETKKWTFTMMMALATLAVALVSSAYTGGIVEIEEDFGIGTEVATLGVSLFVLGFAIGTLRNPSPCFRTCVFTSSS